MAESRYAFLLKDKDPPKVKLIITNIRDFPELEPNLPTTKRRAIKRKRENSTIEDVALQGNYEAVGHTEGEFTSETVDDELVNYGDYLNYVYKASGPRKGSEITKEHLANDNIQVKQEPQIHSEENEESNGFIDEAILPADLVKTEFNFDIGEGYNNVIQEYFDYGSDKYGQVKEEQEVGDSSSHHRVKSKKADIDESGVGPVEDGVAVENGARQDSGGGGGGEETKRPKTTGEQRATGGDDRRPPKTTGEQRATGGDHRRPPKTTGEQRATGRDDRRPPKTTGEQRATGGDDRRPPKTTGERRATGGDDRRPPKTTGEQPADDRSLRYRTTCFVCTERFKTPYAARKHRRTAHPDQVFKGGRPPAAKGGAESAAEKPAWPSLKKKYPRKDVNNVCRFCGKHIKSSFQFKEHEAKHEGKWSFKCTWEGCSAVFFRECKLLRHVDKHRGVRPFTCSRCGKSFMCRLALRLHERGVHEEVNDLVHCHVCKKNVRRRYFPDHMKSHTGENRTSCTFCGKEFTGESSRLRHERIHTDEKRHVCKFCGKAFVQKCNLSEHERIHTGETPYRCRYCREGFRQGTRMKTHERACRFQPAAPPTHGRPAAESAGLSPATQSGRGGRGAAGGDEAKQRRSVEDVPLNYVL